MDDAFVVGPNTRLPISLAVVCLALTAGFGYFAWDERTALLAIPAIVFAVLGLMQIAALRDRSPLFVADQHGIRMPVDGSWIGLLWRELGDVRVENRAGLNDPAIKLVTADGRRVFSAPVGLATDVRVEAARKELARRRSTAAY